MKEENNIIKDEVLKDLLSASKLKAPQNLKYRIMQQIRTESVLKYKYTKVQRISEQLRSIAVVAIGMYTVLLSMVVITYLYDGIPALFSKEFLLAGGFIVFISFVVGGILYVDSDIRQKISGRHKNKQAGNV